MPALNLELVYLGYSETIEADEFAVTYNGQGIDRLVYATDCFVTALNYALDEMISSY